MLPATHSLMLLFLSHAQKFTLFSSGHLVEHGKSGYDEVTSRRRVGTERERERESDECNVRDD
jgi:hypothetical protein